MSYSTGKNDIFIADAKPMPLDATAIPVLYNAAGVSESSKKLLLKKHGSRPLKEKQIQRLIKQGYTRGLSTFLNQMKETFALRIWLIDNSASMKTIDGHRIIPTRDPSAVKMVECTRWKEVCACVNYHIKLAGLIKAPTRFRLLNHPGKKAGVPQFFSVAENPSAKKIKKDMQVAFDIMEKVRPGGCTPLTYHLLEMWEELYQMGPELLRVGKKVAVIIATNGLPSDEKGCGGPGHNQEFVDALRLLEGLPLQVVVRLCTDDEEVINFYKELDVQLDLSIDILDDFYGEAIEVAGENPWLNYSLPLHRLREMGYHDQLFDMLDKRPFTKTEVCAFCALLFGGDNFDESSDWNGFMKDLKSMLRREPPQYNPVKNKLSPWINTRELNRFYNNKASCVALGCVIL